MGLEWNLRRKGYRIFSALFLVAILFSICLVGVLRAEEGALKWRYVTEGSVFSSPAIGRDGTVYLSWYHYLYAINPDGTLKWRYDIGEVKVYISMSSSPAIGPHGTIYVGSVDKYLYAINPDGTLKWRYETGRQVTSSPAIGSDGTVYVGSDYLYAINPDGTLKWRYEPVGGYFSPVIGPDGTVYMGAGDYLYALNSDGTLKWNYEMPGWWNIARSLSIGSDGTIYVGASYTIYAINPDGTLKWSYRTGSRVDSSPAIGSDGTIYIGSLDKYLYALNPDGTLKWRYETGDGVDSSPAIGADGTVYVMSEDNYFYALNPDGTLKWRYEIWSLEHGFSPAISSDGTVYIVSSGVLYAIQTSSMGVADSSWPMFRHDPMHTGRFTEQFKAQAGATQRQLSVTADVSALSGDVPFLAAFSIKASGGAPPYSFNWSFGDGSSSSEQNPAYTYQIPGVYTATVTVTDSNGATSTVTITVTVKEPPNTPPAAVITLNTPNSGDVPFEVRALGGHSSDPDGTIAQWKWSFGDGSPDASTMDVAHIYTSPGQYVLTLTVTDNRGATATATQAIVVNYANKPPTASITVSATEGTVPLNVAFAGSGTDPEGGQLSFHWVFGDGEEGDGRAINHTFSTQGDYTVRLIVTDDAGKQGTSDVAIHAKEAPQASPLSVSLEASVKKGTAPLAVAFNVNVNGGSPPYSYAYDFGDGAKEGIGESAIHTYASKGIYTTKVVVTDSKGASKESFIIITVTGGEVESSSGGGRHQGGGTPSDDTQQGESGPNKAIIIAGSGAVSANPLFVYTDKFTRAMYDLLRSRGYGHGDIYYLTPQLNSDTASRYRVDYSVVDDQRIKEAFEKVRDTIGETGQFVFYLHGHGRKDAIRINRSDWMPVSRLNELLNMLPQGAIKVIIIDTCYSGSFLDDLKGTNRIVIAASSSNSWTSISGVSFSKHLIDSLRYQSLDVNSAFLRAKEIIQGQDPSMDDDGDGVYSIARDGSFASTVTIGTSLAGGLPPEVSAHYELRMDEDDPCAKTIWAKVTEGDGGKVKKVTAVVVPPDFSSVFDVEKGTYPIGVDEVELIYNPAQDRWELYYGAFIKSGQWRIYYEAEDESGQISNTAAGVVIVPEGMCSGGTSSKARVNKSVFTAGDRLVFSIQVNANGRYDIYAAIVIPGGTFITFYPNSMTSFPMQAVAFRAGEELSGIKEYTVFELKAPSSIPKGDYMGCIVITPPAKDPLTASNWVTYDCREFRIK